MSSTHITCTIVSLQVVSSDWMLGVQILNFESYINAERNNDSQYCCCDVADNCSDTLMNFTSTFTCTSECQTYLVVHLVRCPDSIRCSFIKTFNFLGYSPFDLSSLVFQIPFGATTQKSQVRNTRLINVK